MLKYLNCVHFSMSIFCLKFHCRDDTGTKKTVQVGMGMATRPVGTGWGWEQGLREWGGDGNSVAGMRWGWGRTADPVQISKKASIKITRPAELPVHSISLVRIQVLHLEYSPTQNSHTTVYFFIIRTEKTFSVHLERSCCEATDL